MKVPMSNLLLRAIGPRTARLAVVVALAGVLPACDKQSPTGVGTLASITVTPNATVAINATQQFVAVGKDLTGAEIAIAPAWSIDAGGGVINDAGLFTAGTVPGTYTATIKAVSNGVSGTASVTVNVGPLATITITTDTLTLPISGTQQYVAVGKDAGGNIVPLIPSWSVAAGGGTISSAGLFTAGTRPGAFPNTIEASSWSVKGTATVTVSTGPLASITVSPNTETLPANGVQQYAAVGKDAAGNIVSISPSWSVVAGGGAIETSAQFTAGSVSGTFTNTIKATIDGKSGFATVVIAPAPTGPSVVTLGVAETFGILAGSTVTCVNLGVVHADIGVWAGSAITGFGPCLADGSLHAADAPAQAAQSALTVAYNQLDALPCGATLTADLGGRTLQPGVYCSLSSQGLTGEMFFDALGDPNATLVIKAASALTTASARVTLLNGAQAKNIYWLMGSSATIGVGSAMKGNLVALTSITLVDNSTLLGRALARNGAVTLGTNNVITLPGGGGVIVGSGLLARILVSPNPDTLCINGTQQFTAVGMDASGNIVAISPTWSSGGAGTITSGGLFTAGTMPGNWANSIFAISGGITGYASVKVKGCTPPPPPPPAVGTLATIEVTPNPDTLIINGTQQFTAIGRDAAGNIVPISITWSSGGAGTITAGGFFTAGTMPGNWANSIVATSGGITGYASIKVKKGPLATITVTPNPVTLSINGKQVFTAVGTDAGGNTIPITPTWSVVAGCGAINATTGEFTAGTVVGTCANTVKASSGSLSGFATVVVTAPAPIPSVVDLGVARTFGILAGTTITCINLGKVNGDVGLFPGSAITGFPTCELTGERHAADIQAHAAQDALTAAYLQLAGMPCGINLTADLAGATLQPGVFCSLAQGLTGEMFFDALGDPNATFVIKSASTLITAGARVTLLNGAQAKNIYWLVGSSATIGVGSDMKGNILALTSIALMGDATLLGRALARNGAVTLGTNNLVTLP